MKPYIIGVTGGSGSGKTTLIRYLCKNFSEEDLCIISQDDYYRPREEQQRDKEGVINFDLPGAIDKKSFNKDIKRLLLGQVIRKQEYTFNNELRDPRMLEFHPAPVIIIEGLFVMHYKKIKRHLDLKVFVHAKDNLKVIRRIKRDQIERN